MMRRPTASSERGGFALLMVLVMLALSAALLAGSSAWALAATRGTRAVRAALVAESAAQRAVAEALHAWSSAEDAISVGAAVERDASVDGAPLDSAAVRLRVQRLSARVFAIVAQVRVPATGAPLATRRLRVLVERRATADSASNAPPTRIGRWATSELP